MKRYLKTILSTVLSYLIVISMIPFASFDVHAASYTGNGTESNPFIVSTGAELVEVFNTYNTEDVYIELDNNITLDETYEPIWFKGHFDGNFYKITAKTNFLYSNSGTIKNFYYVDTVVRTEGLGSNAGIVCDDNSGVISGVIATGHLEFDCYHTSSGDNDVDDPNKAAIISGTGGTIINCAAFGSVKTDCSYGSRAAGISVSGKVINCYSAAEVIAIGGSRYGTGYDDAISLGEVVNSYYNQDLYTDKNYGLTTSEMRTSVFVDSLNSKPAECDSKWIMDTSNKNSGYPILTRSLNESITSSKSNVLIDGTESIALTCSDSTAKIYYTTNGTKPTTASKLYSSPLTISADTTINAIAYKNGLYSSPYTFRYSKINGDGTESSPYIINSEVDLLAIPELNDNDGYFALSNDITMTTEMPHLGDFYGVFEGNGYAINNVYTATRINGIFDTSYGIVRNLTLNIKSNARLISNAGLVVNNYGIIYNCNINGYLDGEDLSYGGSTTRFGGIAANNFGRIEKCNFDGYVYSENVSRAGGIVGHNNGVITLCGFSGTVYIYAVTFDCKQGYVGGFVGYNGSSGNISYSVVNADKVFSAPRHYSGVIVGSFVGGEAETSAINYCSANAKNVNYDHFYTEWGTNGTNNRYGGSGVLENTPDVHEHDFSHSLMPPVCGQERSYEYVCSCGINFTSAGVYDDYYRLDHDYFEAECVITQNATCAEHGEYVRYCNTCNYADTFDVLPSNHNEMMLVDPNLYPESLHKYDNEATETDVFTYPGATQLQITFSSRSNIGYKDYLYIYDGSDKCICSYTNKYLGEVTVTIPGDTVKFKLVPSGSSTYYGYSLSYIYADCPNSETVVDKSLYPESTHDYANNANETKTFSYPGATELSVKFSESTKVERNYDYIYLYDANGNLIGKYTDTQLAGQTITIPGNSFKIKLTSDVSYTYYGYSFDSIVAKMVHDNWEITKENTCTENGEKKRTCSLCGEEVIKEITAPGHTRETIPSVPATCTETGLTSGTKCTVCNEILVAQQTVAAKGHKYTAVETPATCTEDGMMTYTCSACGDSYTEVIAAFNHNLGEVMVDKSKYPESAHNYTNNLSQTKTFSWSGAQKLIITFSSSTKVESNYDYIYLYDANDVLLGKYTGTSLAGKKIVITGDAFKIKLTSNGSNIFYGYSFDSIVADMGGYGIWQTVTNPTCVEKGSEKRVCSLCGEEETREIPELGHDMVEHGEIAPDCTNTGMTAGSQCSRCDHKIGLEVIPELGHDMVEQIRVEPDCINGGMTEGAQCSRCEHKVGLEDIPSLGHDMIKDDAVAPDCVNTGLTEGSHCSRCDHKIEQVVIPELGHDMVSFEEVAPDCTNTGMTAGSQCSRCDHKIGLEVIPELGHDMVSFEEVAPDCTNTGMTAGSQCSRCNHKVGLEVIPELGHDMVEYGETAPGCTSDGMKAGSKCSRCDHKVGCEVIPAYNHDAREYLITTSEYPESQHNYTNGLNETKTFTWQGAKKLTVTFSASTKVENNYDKIYLYDGNGKQIGVYTDVALAGKSITINGDTIKIKLTSDVSVSYYGYSITSIVADMGGYGNWQTVKEPGCMENGLEKKVCSICGAEETNELPSLGGHVSGEQVVENSTAATCGATGSYDEVVYCTVCDEELSRSTITTDKLPHTEEVLPAVAPTCTETGLTEGVKCTSCSEILKAQEEIPELGHNFDHTKNESNLIRPTETADGYYIYKCKNNCDATETETVKRADYSSYDEALKIINGYHESSEITDAAKQAIYNKFMQFAEDNSGYTDEKGVLRKDLTEAEQGVVDSATSFAENIIVEIENKILNEEIVKADYTEIDKKIKAVDKLLENYSISNGMKAELDDIKSDLEELKKDTDASKAAVADVLATLVERIDRIALTIEGCANGSHLFTNYVTATEPECEIPGKKVAVCDYGCGATDEKSIEAPGHTEKVLPAEGPTCTETGLTEGIICLVCNKTIKAQNVIEASGHDPGEAMVENIKDSTCGAAGSYEEAVYCTACNEELSREFKTVDSLPHSYDGGVVTTAPTCIENGVKTVTCSVCGDWYTEPIPELNHDIVIDNAVEPTCTETGLTEGQHCSRCDDATVEQEIVTVKPHNHIAKNDSVKHWKECSCGSIIEEQNHSFVGGNICLCGFERVVNSAIRIRNNNGSKTINYGETLKLTANVTNKPVNAKIYWYVDNVKAGEGEAFNVKFESGTKIITVKLVDANGVVYQNSDGKEISDSENVTVNSGFFQKIISFFKNLFGMNRTVVQTIFKGIY